jgi:hypothetical protein
MTQQPKRRLERRQPRGRLWVDPNPTAIALFEAMQATTAAETAGPDPTACCRCPMQSYPRRRSPHLTMAEYVTNTAEADGGNFSGANLKCSGRSQSISRRRDGSMSGGPVRAEQGNVR